MRYVKFFGEAYKCLTVYASQFSDNQHVFNIDMESFAHPLRRAMTKFFDEETLTDLVPWHLHNLRHTSKSFLV